MARDNYRQEICNMSQQVSREQHARQSKPEALWGGKVPSTPLATQLTFLNAFRKFSEKQLYRIGLAIHRLVYASTWLKICMETVKRVVSYIWRDFSTSTIWLVECRSVVEKEKRKPEKAREMYSWSLINYNEELPRGLAVSKRAESGPRTIFIISLLRLRHCRVLRLWNDGNTQLGWIWIFN
jgi:hypothetical protein